jgi:hypothetical protein
MVVSSNHRRGLVLWLVPGLLCLVGCGLFKDESLLVPSWYGKNPTRANDNRPRFLGTSTPGATVEVFLEAGCQGEPSLRTAVSDDMGFEVVLEVPDDSVTKLSSRTVLDEETSACSTTITYTEDSTPPAVPTLTNFDPPSPGQSRSPLLIGKTSPGATVSLYGDADCKASLGRNPVQASTQGRFEFRLSDLAANAATAVHLLAEDEVKNRSACSSAVTYVHDNVAPPSPKLTGYFPKSPANNNAPRLLGTAEPGASLVVFPHASSCYGVTELARVTVGADGTFEFPFSVADNMTQSFSVRVEDAAGNDSSCVPAGQYVEDSIAPAPPVLATGSPTSPGTSLTPFFQGTFRSDTQAVLLFGSDDCSGTPLATATLSGSAFGLRAPTVAAESSSVFSLVAQDAAGNASTCVGPIPYLHDSLPPSAVGASVEDGPDADLDVRLDGFLEAHWSGFTDANGVFRYQFAVATQPGCQSGSAIPWQYTSERSFRQSSSADGVYYTCVRAQDAAGNFSQAVSSDGVRVDTQPPRIASHSPQSGQNFVDIRSLVSIVFTEPVEPASVPSRLTVSANGAALAGSVACAQQTCTFTPAEPLPYLETVTVTVAAEVRDTVGRQLGAPYSFSFVTRARRWSSQPSQLSTIRPSMSAEVALDGLGRALAIWAQGLGDGSVRVYSSIAAPNSTWAPAQAIDPGAQGNVGRLALAINAAGRAMGAWELQNGPQADLMAAEYLPATGWSVPQPVESRLEPVSHPRLVVDGQGRTVAVWRQSDGTAESLWAAHHVPGQGWAAPLLLEVEAGGVSAPALAMDSLGNALVAWLQPDDGGLRVLTSRYSPGAGWTPPTLVSSSAMGATVAVSMSTGGSAMVLFRRSEPFSIGTIHRLYAAREEGSQGWSAPVAVSGTGLSVDADFAVALDAQGVALTAWTLASSNPSLHTCRFTPEQGWAACQQGDSTTAQPSVGVDRGGNFILAWVSNSGGTDYAVTARYPAGASALGALHYLEGHHAGASKRPRLAVNAPGSAVVVWARDNGSGNSGNLVYGNLFE